MIRKLHNVVYANYLQLGSKNFARLHIIHVNKYASMNLKNRMILAVLSLGIFALISAT